MSRISDRERLRRIAQIIEQADQRRVVFPDEKPMATLLEEMSVEEIREIYQLAARLDTARPAHG